MKSTNNNPPSFRTNADGRITNLDEILENIDMYSEAELAGLLTQLHAALKNINHIMGQTFSIVEKHTEKIPKLRIHIRGNIENISQGITPSDEVETSLLEDAVDEIRVEGSLIGFALEGIEEYIQKLMNLLEQIKERLPF